MQKPQKNMRFNALQGVSATALGYLGIIIASTLLLVAGLLAYLYEHGIDLTTGITIEQITDAVVAQKWVFFLGLFLNQLAYLTAGFGVGAYSKVDTIKACGLNKKPHARDIALSVAIALVSIYLLSASGGLFGMLLEFLGYQPYGLGVEFSGATDFILGFLIIACLAPLGEELIYRGILQESITKRDKPYKAVLLSALAFMLMHSNPEQTVYQFLLGLALGFVMLKTRNLWLPIIIHAINNLLALIFEYAPILYNGVYDPLYELHPALLSVILLVMTALGAAIIYFLIRLMKPQQDTLDTAVEGEPSQAVNQLEAKNKVAVAIYIILCAVCLMGWLTTFFSRLG